MIDNKILSEYLVSKMCWSNKETLPLVEIESFVYNDNKVFSGIKVKHSVKFKKKDEVTVFPYLNSIECTIFLSDLISFIRQKNLDYLIYSL